MKLALVMMIAYIPFLWWVFKQAREDMKDDDSSRRNAEYLSNKNNNNLS